MYDEKVAKKRSSDKAESEMKAVDKLRSNKSNTTLLRNIALTKNVITFAEFEEYTDEEVYLELYNYSKNYPSEFIEACEDTHLVNKSNIRKYVEVGILKIDVNENICSAKNEKIILGSTMEEAAKYLANPIHSGEVSKFEKEYKSLK